jgi:hypothetical protein
MPEVSTLFNGVQVGAETTSSPGTAVSATKLLNYLSFQPTFWAGDFQTMNPMGQKVASGAAPGYDYTQWALNSDVGSYSELIYPFCSLLKDVSPSTVETTAKLWTFKPTGRSEDVIRTFTVESGSSTRAQKATFVAVTGMELTFNRSTGVTLSGTAIGQQIQDNIALTGSPTAVEDVPILPTHLDVYLDATSGGIGGTKLTRDFNAVFRYNDARAAVWAINSANASFVNLVETRPTVEIELTVEADSQGMGPLVTARAGTTQYIRLSAVSTVVAGAGTAKYQLVIDCAGKITGISGPDDSDGIKAVTYTFSAVYDSAWASGTYLTIGLQNKTATL